MNTEAGLKRCLSFINCQMQPAGQRGRPAETTYKCAITISREAGCGAHAFAEKLAQRLDAEAAAGNPPWTIFDRNLVEKVLEEHQLPNRLASYMPEDRVLEIDDIMDELFGLRPSSWTLVEKTAETLLHLADVGNVILIGRGANIATARLPHMVHVRLTGTPERRAENLQHYDGLTPAKAMEQIRNEDHARARYVRKHYHEDVSNPLLYHLVINTDHIELDEAAELVVGLVLKRREWESTHSLPR